MRGACGRQASTMLLGWLPASLKYGSKTEGEAGYLLKFVITLSAMRTLLGIGLVLVFAIAVMGCGTGFLPSMTAMHNGGNECSTMFVDTFVVSSKDLRFLQVALLLLTSLLLPLLGFPPFSAQGISLQQGVTQTALRTIYGLSQLYNLLLRLFSNGVLHPQKYNTQQILN